MSSTYGQIDGFKGRKDQTQRSICYGERHTECAEYVWIWAGAARAQVSGEALGGLP